jgi:hypothetical protein
MPNQLHHLITPPCNDNLPPIDKLAPLITRLIETMNSIKKLDNNMNIHLTIGNQKDHWEYNL